MQVITATYSLRKTSLGVNNMLNFDISRVQHGSLILINWEDIQIMNDKHYFVSLDW